MAARVFVDTNVLVYSRDASEPQKNKQAIAWMSHLWNMRAGRLSYQVLQEFYITVTEKLDPGLDRESARKDIRSLLPWRPISVDNRVFDGAWHIQDRFGLSWWDALIVSASLLAGVGQGLFNGNGHVPTQFFNCSTFCQYQAFVCVIRGLLLIFRSSHQFQIVFFSF